MEGKIAGALRESEEKRKAADQGTVKKLEAFVRREGFPAREEIEDALTMSVALDVRIYLERRRSVLRSLEITPYELGTVIKDGESTGNYALNEDRRVPGIRYGIFVDKVRELVQSQEGRFSLEEQENKSTIRYH